MNLFNRRKKVDPNLPPEVQAYSQAERRERMGVAWLFGIVSLIVTFVLITGLFFGGRWVYRKIARKDKATPVQIDTSDDSKTEDQKNKDAEDQSDASDDTPVDTEQTPSTPAPTSNTPQTPATQPSTGDTLPNTGPDVDL